MKQNKSSFKKWLVAAGIGLGACLISACGDAGSSGKAVLPVVETTSVVGRSLEERITVSGFVKPETVTEIKSEINGRIIRILVENGQTVKRGDLLLEIDPQTYQTTVDSNERTTRQRRLDVEKAERDMKRIKQLFERDFATEQEYLDSVTDYESRKLQLEIAQAALDNAKIELAKTAIKAPHDGMVSDLDVYVGNVISGAGSFSNGTTLMKVNDMSNLRVEADLNEIEANKIVLGAETQLTFDSLPKTSFKGTVNYLSSFGVQDSATSTLYKFPVRVNFTTGGVLVRPGTSANLSILVAGVTDAVSVPASAIFIEDGVRYVFVKKGEGQFERRKVEIGIGNLNFIQVVQGLQLGDEIATVRPSQSEIVGGVKAPRKR
ncbi:MAG: efflux RND transporter periplasmic adaptor subunit [Opitutales bacterium]|nr:efflux RND transporter periplasmic adaptor subunit [Opitutales bacterium]